MPTYVYKFVETGETILGAARVIHDVDADEPRIERPHARASRREAR